MIGTDFWATVRELAVMRENVPEERRAMSGVLRVLEADSPTPAPAAKSYPDTNPWIWWEAVGRLERVRQASLSDEIDAAVARLVCYMACTGKLGRQAQPVKSTAADGTPATDAPWRRA